MNKIKTLGELKKSGYVSRSIKDEIRENLIKKIKAKENAFPGILGSQIRKGHSLAVTTSYFLVYVDRQKPVWPGK
jgi:hypothetical protein